MKTCLMKPKVKRFVNCMQEKSPHAAGLGAAKVFQAHCTKQLGVFHRHQFTPLLHGLAATLSEHYCRAMAARRTVLHALLFTGLYVTGQLAAHFTALRWC